MATPHAESGSGSGPGVLLSGTVPPLADAYFPRELTLADALRPGETAVLVHGGETELAPAAQGGTGKTQLAVEFAHAMWNTRAVEALVWVNAASRDSVVTGFAQAANVVDAGQLDEGAEEAAARFVSWLQRTRRPWALVLDDLAELSDLEGLWPAGPAGRILVTTRLPASAFDVPSFAGFQVIGVSGLNRREALDYLTSRLSDYPDQRIEALDLGERRDARTKVLSGGQRQRLSVALALVNEPEVLFLDEPTTGMDPQARRSLWGLIRELADRGTTVLLTTHYMEEAEELCDRIAIMDHGRILEMGGVAELVERRFHELSVRFDDLPDLPSPSLEALPGVTRVMRDDGVAALYTADVAGTIGGLLAMTAARGTEPGNLTVRRATLEDVFLDLTGRELRA